MEQQVTDNKKISYSAVQPTGKLTLGNYIGALSNWVKFQRDYNCIYTVADLHAITVEIEPKILRQNTMDIFALMLSIGIDPENSTLFVQSHVPYHTELTWILNCFTQFGEAKRMTQFKDKSQKSPQNVNVGLFDYPVLMAADILLYNADIVPIGKDQKQHMELAKVIAERFNNRYSPTFTVPASYIPKSGAAKVFSLSDPSKKMSKSDEDPHGAILMLDSPDIIASKFKRAVTDSDTAIRFDTAQKPGVSNLLTIYSNMTDLNIKQTELHFEGKNYAALKAETSDAVIAKLKPIQEKHADYLKNKDYLLSLMKNGAEKASNIAYKTVAKVKRKVGFLPL